MSNEAQWKFANFDQNPVILEGFVLNWVKWWQIRVKIQQLGQTLVKSNQAQWKYANFDQNPAILEGLGGEMNKKQKIKLYFNRLTSLTRLKPDAPDEPDAPEAWRAWRAWGKNNSQFRAWGELVSAACSTSYLTGLG